MSVGTTAIVCYEKEDVNWKLTLTDPNVIDISTWAIQLVVKLLASSADPPLLGPITCTIPGAANTLDYFAAFNISLAPGSYVYSARRVDVGFDWQTAQAALTVLDSASK